MSRREFTVIHAVSIVETLNRAGQHAGQTNVAKLAGITPPRAKKILVAALKLGLLYTYNDRYRPNVMRPCYGVSSTGKQVADRIADHKNTTIWGLSNE